MSLKWREKKGGTGKKGFQFQCIIRESNTGLVDGNDEFYH